MYKRLFYFEEINLDGWPRCWRELSPGCLRDSRQFDTFSMLHPFSVEEVFRLLSTSPTKHCLLDPVLQIWLLKHAAERFALILSCWSPLLIFFGDKMLQDWSFALINHDEERIRQDIGEYLNYFTKNITDQNVVFCVPYNDTGGLGINFKFSIKDLLKQSRCRPSPSSSTGGGLHCRGERAPNGSEMPI